jgi:hypothetical protein
MTSLVITNLSLLLAAVDFARIIKHLAVEVAAGFPVAFARIAAKPSRSFYEFGKYRATAVRI